MTPNPRTAGFTLLELLIVVTILVGLTVAVGSVALNYLGRARGDTARIQMTQITTGLDLYRVDLGVYPRGQDGLDALLVAPPSTSDRWNGPYVSGEDILSDPWGNPFGYAGDGAAYELYSLGADGQTGGENDAADIRP